MICEFIYNKNLINLRKHFPVDFDELDGRDQRSYLKLQRINERKNRKKKGVLIAEAFMINDVLTVCIGWSLCKFKTKKRPKGNIFNEARCFEIAVNRAMDYGNEQLLILHNIPPSIQKQLERFVERARKYYHVDDQDVVFSPWINTFINNRTITDKEITEFITNFPSV